MTAVTITCFVSTGMKRVLHTLWIQSIIKRPGLSGGGFINYSYIKNLPADESEAIKIAKEFAKENFCNFTGVEDSPIYKKASHIEIYGIQFKHKRKKGKSFYFGYATQEFFDEWKKNKQQLKDEGFSLSKYKHPIHGTSDWYVFYKPKEE